MSQILHNCIYVTGFSTSVFSWVYIYIVLKKIDHFNDVYTILNNYMGGPGRECQNEITNHQEEEETSPNRNHMIADK